MTSPPDPKPPAPEKPINPWLILAAIILPGLLAVPFISMTNDLVTLYVLPVLGGIFCMVLFIKDGLRIQRDEDPDLASGVVILRAIFFGFACMLASGAFLWGACLCTIMVSLSSSG